MGRYPGAQQSHAALVGLDVLRHDPLGDRLYDRVSGVAADLRCDDRHARLVEPRHYRNRACQRQAGTGRHGRQLSQFAIAGGASAFKVNCAQCHGSGAAGFVGFPNLNDDDWVWGGTVDNIYHTIAHGIRHPGDDETRVSEMPAYGDILQPEEIKQVAAFVVSLTGTPADAGMVEPGKQIFADNCAACHGDDARGNHEMGAPNLADAIWLKGEGEAAIAAQIKSPKHGVMPAWLPRLGDPAVKQLAVFVHSLGGGE
jgi:cytochrome c oxidase cbb3-type subunit III